MKQIYLIIGYLVAIIAANLLVTQFGPAVAVVNAFLFIGLDLTTRDYLHDAWQGHHFWDKMLMLIGTGSILSYALNHNAGQIAMASFIAFAAAGLTDTVIYLWLGDRSRLLKINGSNIGSAAVDSIVFPTLAFGFPLLWGIMLGQFVAKVGGGFIWSMILEYVSKREN